MTEGEGWLFLTWYVPRKACASVKSARESSLAVKGARIFNLLPAWIRTLNDVSIDQPTCPGRQRAAASNSLLDQLQLIFKVQLFVVVNHC